MANRERTFIAIKPDGVQRRLVGDIIKRFEQKGFRLVALKLMQLSGHICKTSAQQPFNKCKGLTGREPSSNKSKKEK